MRRLTLSVFVLICIALPSIAQTAGRTVDLTSADGTKLKGSFFAAAKPGPGVLLLHQCNKDRKIWDGLAQQLASSGINVLTFDLRNFGDSEGKPFAKLTQPEIGAASKNWPADVDAAFQYLVSQPNVKRDVIGVGGGSCGVDNSVQAAIRHAEVKSLVLLAGGTDLKGRQYLHNAKIPVLFGYADDDEFPQSIVGIQWLYALDPNQSKKLVRYDKGGHAAEIFAVHPEFQGVIRDWFVTTLIKTPGRAPAETAKPKLDPGIEAVAVFDEPGGIEKAKQTFAEARKKDPKATPFPEAMVNIVGYDHIQSGDTKGAVEIMKMNAEAFPNSANVYDSLSDAYLADGQKELALLNAKKALELLPNDPSLKDEQARAPIRQSAEQKVKQLQQ